MLSRRSRIQEKKTQRLGVFFLFASIILLLLLIFFGLGYLAKFAALVNDFKNSSQPIISDDKTPPAPPHLTNQPPEFTNKDSLSLSGSAESGSTVIVIKDGENDKEFVVDDTGTFTYQANLKDGENTFRFKATDPTGNTSDESQTYTIVYDASPPSIEITKPQDGQSFLGSEKNINVEGKTETQAQLTINDRLTIISSEGTFSQTVRLSEGENTITIVVSDQAGNQEERVIKVSYAP